MATYSNWREDLIEVIDTPTTEKKAEKKVKESKVNNKVVINPTFKEAVAEMGGQILEVAEVDDKKGTEEDPQIKSKQKRQGMLKRQVLLKKLQAVRSGGGADITAGYEPEGDIIEGIKGEDNETRKAAALERKAGKKTRLSPSAGKANVAKMLWDIRNAKSNPQNESTVSVAGKANTAIRNVEREEKLKRINKTLQAMRKQKGDFHPLLHNPKGGATAADLRGEEVVKEGVMKMVKRVMSKKKPEKKAEKAMDAGARAKRQLARKVHAKYVSGSEDIVPDDIREADDKAYNYVVSKLKKQYGDGVLTKGDKIKPLSPEQKKAKAAHDAKIAKERAAEFKKDPSQGRYPPGYSNRGSD